MSTVKRRDDEHGMHTHALRVPGELDGLPSTGGANPDHERHAPTDDPSHLLDKALAFLASEVRGLAGASQGRDAVHPGLYKVFDHRLRGHEVHLRARRRA